MIKLNEVIKAARANGRKVLKQDIAARLWPDTTPENQRVNMTNLCSGKVERISPTTVQIICEMTGCTADELFNIKPLQNESN